MKRITCLALSVLMLFAVAPIAFGAEYDTIAGSETPQAARAAKSLEPLARETRTTKAYSLVSDYATGQKTGDLRSQATECTVESREEPAGQFHLEFVKRGESRVNCRFFFEPRGSAPRVTMRLTHMAPVPNQGHIDVNVNGTSVVYGWSPDSRVWHTTSWEIGQTLRPGENTLEIRLGQAPKMYWFKRIELSASSDCIFRDPAGPGPDPNGDRWQRLLGEARRAFDDGRLFADQGDRNRARAAFQACLDKADRLAVEAPSPYREEARELVRRARFELQNLGGGGGTGGYDDEVFRAAYQWAYSPQGLDKSREGAEAFARDMASRVDINGFRRYQEAYQYCYSPQGLDMNRAQAEQAAWEFMNVDINWFKQLYAFAYSPQGMDLTRQQAYEWARTHLNVPREYIANYQAAYQYLYSPSGCDLTKERAREMADELARYPRQALEDFKRNYSYAYSPSGMNMSREQAMRYAMERLHATYR